MDAVASHPALDEVIAFPRKQLGKWWRSPGSAKALWRWMRDIRRRQFDLVLDCQGLGRSGLITRFSGAERRVGHRHAREGAWFAYNIKCTPPDPNEKRHTVESMLDLVAELGIEPVRDMRLYVGESDKSWWRGQCEKHGWEVGQYVVIAPTARWTSKRWPIERWRSILTALPDCGWSNVVMTGSTGEKDQVAGIKPNDSGQALNFVDLVGKLTVGQLLAVVADAGFVLANDSAPLHIAVGFDRPLVALFGPTDPATVGPFGREMDVICKAEQPASGKINFKDPNLGDRYMRLITVDNVLEQIDQLR